MMSAHPDNKDTAADESAKGRMEWLRFILGVLWLPAALYLVLTFVLSLGSISGPSMQPAYDDNTIVAAFRWAGLKHQDVVLIQSGALGEPIVKRAVGLPGDTLKIEDGIVYRNGQALDEPYVEYPGGPDVPELVVPEHMLFVLGDNRAVSLDSRFTALGLVPEQEVVGVVIFSARLPFSWSFLKKGS